jgi:hypothetical protein
MKLKKNLFQICWYFILCKSCLANFQSNNNDNNIKKFNNVNSSLYLVYECKFFCGGWADRLKGIMSVYMLSLLTNRPFLIDMRTPCNLNKLIRPNNVDWRVFNKKLNLNSRENRIYRDCLNDFNATCLTELDYKVITSSGDKEIFAIKTNQDWFRHFSNSSRFKSQIIKLGFNASQNFKLHLVFHQFYQSLLKLAPKLEEKYIKAKKDAHLTKRTKIYCAQIRIGMFIR